MSLRREAVRAGLLLVVVGAIVAAVGALLPTIMRSVAASLGALPPATTPKAAEGLLAMGMAVAALGIAMLVVLSLTGLRRQAQ